MTCANSNVPLEFCTNFIMAQWKVRYMTCTSSNLIQLVRLLVSVRAYQAVNSVFLSQQISTSRVYQSRNQRTGRFSHEKNEQISSPIIANRFHQIITALESFLIYYGPV